MSANNAYILKTRPSATNYTFIITDNKMIKFMFNIKTLPQFKKVSKKQGIPNMAMKNSLRVKNTSGKKRRVVS